MLLPFSRPFLNKQVNSCLLQVHSFQRVQKALSKYDIRITYVIDSLKVKNNYNVNTRVYYETLITLTFCSNGLECRI